MKHNLIWDLISLKISSIFENSTRANVKSIFKNLYNSR